MSYDTVATAYAELLGAELARKPLDRALLATFAELVAAAVGRAYGHAVALDVHRVPIDLVADLLAAADLVGRHPGEAGARRTGEHPQGYLLAHQPTGPAD